MYRADRLRAMTAHLQENPALTVGDAMRLFDTSSATVRRDFSRLIASGAVTRGPNEIRRVETAAGVDKPVAEREITMRREKDAIARRAAGFLRDGDAAFIDGGTTTHGMVRFLPPAHLRIITPCIRIANSLNGLHQDNSTLDVVMPGGVLSERSYVLYGPRTCAHLELYHARWAFIGVDGTDGANLFSVNEFISSSQRVMIANSDRTVLLADHTKFGRQSMVRTAGLDGRFVIVTDEHESSAGMIRAARRAGVEVICV